MSHRSHGRRLEGGLRLDGVERQSPREMPLVSIITVVRNGREHLGQTIRSVLDQSYGNVEYVVIDGGSTDGTLEVIRAHTHRIDYWVSEPDGGIYDAMNKGLRCARGDLIALLNAGDFYEVEALASAVDSYRSNGFAAAVYYGHTYLLQCDLGLRYEYPARADHVVGMGFFHPAMFAHRHVYDRIGVYDTTYRLAADYDWVLRAVRRGVPFVGLDAFVANYRNTGVSARNVLRTLSEIGAVSRRHFGSLSTQHARFLLSYSKTACLVTAERLATPVLGDTLVRRAKRLYTRAFLSRGRET